jgi:hypothetical protein
MKFDYLSSGNSLYYEEGNYICPAITLLLLSLRPFILAIPVPSVKVLFIICHDKQLISTILPG